MLSNASYTQDGHDRPQSLQTFRSLFYSQTINRSVPKLVSSASIRGNTLYSHSKRSETCIIFLENMEMTPHPITRSVPKLWEILHTHTQPYRRCPGTPNSLMGRWDPIHPWHSRSSSVVKQRVRSNKLFSEHPSVAGSLVVDELWLSLRLWVNGVNPVKVWIVFTIPRSRE